MSNLKMNWGTGYDNHRATPFDDVLIKLIETSDSRFGVMDVWFTDGEARRYKRIRFDGLHLNLNDARKSARTWLEANLDSVLQAQADTAPMPMSAKQQFDFLHQKTKLQAELDQVLRDHDRALMNYRIEYDRAARGERTKSVPTDQYKTFPVYATRRVRPQGGWFGDDPGWDWEQYQIGEERVRQYKEVPDYPEEPKYPARAHQLKRLIEEIDQKLG